MSDKNENFKDMSVKAIGNTPKVAPVQLFTNVGAPVLLADGASVPSNSQWVCIGITSDAVVLRPVVPIEGQDENMAVTITPAIIQLAFTISGSDNDEA